MKRYLAHQVIVSNVDHGMSVAEISDDGQQLKVMPFTGEIHSTVFINGTVRFIHTPLGWQIDKSNK